VFEASFFVTFLTVLFRFVGASIILHSLCHSWMLCSSCIYLFFPCFRTFLHFLFWCSDCIWDKLIYLCWPFFPESVNSELLVEIQKDQRRLVIFLSIACVGCNMPYVCWIKLVGCTPFVRCEIIFIWTSYLWLILPSWLISFIFWICSWIWGRLASVTDVCLLIFITYMSWC
jgi:hypothetical protein